MKNQPLRDASGFGNAAGAGAGVAMLAEQIQRGAKQLIAPKRSHRAPMGAAFARARHQRARSHTNRLENNNRFALTWSESGPSRTSVTAADPASGAARIPRYCAWSGSHRTFRSTHCPTSPARGFALILPCHAPSALPDRLRRVLRECGESDAPSVRTQPRRPRRCSAAGQLPAPGPPPRGSPIPVQYPPFRLLP